MHHRRELGLIANSATGAFSNAQRGYLPRSPAGIGIPA